MHVHRALLVTVREPDAGRIDLIHHPADRRLHAASHRLRGRILLVHTVQHQTVLALRQAASGERLPGSVRAECNAERRPVRRQFGRQSNAGEQQPDAVGDRQHHRRLDRIQRAVGHRSLNASVRYDRQLHTQMLQDQGVQQGHSRSGEHAQSAASRPGDHHRSEVRSFN